MKGEVLFIGIILLLTAVSYVPDALHLLGKLVVRLRPRAVTPSVRPVNLRQTDGNTATDPSRTDGNAVTIDGELRLEEFPDFTDETPHIFVKGSSGSGKTTFVYNLIPFWVERGYRVIACDIDAAEGQYQFEGCSLYGKGGDADEILKHLKRVKQLFNQRKIRRGKHGTKHFRKTVVLLEEYAQLAIDIPALQQLVEPIIRGGRKLGIHLVLSCQDSNVSTLQWFGSGVMRQNFAYFVGIGFLCVDQVDWFHGSSHPFLPALSCG